MTSFTAGLASGYILTVAMVVWCLGIGAAVGFFTCCLFAGSGADRCADEACGRRVR